MKLKKRAARTKDSGPGTQVVVRTLSILRALGLARSERRLTDLANDVGLHKATVFRLLGALEQQGMVVRDSVKQTYRLGPMLIWLGGQARRSMGLFAAAHADLEALAESSGETATLEILVDGEVIIMDEVVGRSLISTRPEMGMRFPAHATSTGKVLLADLRTRDAGVRLPSRLARVTPHTITSRAEFDRELARVARRGWAVANEEIEVGFVAVAAPVRDAEGRAIAALSVQGPKSRFSAKKIAESAADLRKAASRVEARLGSVDPGGE
jgi:DNA-binding IclR family transcriptional regulator